jgi:DNA polymerase III epsilon subunit-like protein
MIQLAAVDSLGKQFNDYIYLVPPRTLPDFITQLTGITPQTLATGLPLSQVLERFKAFVGAGPAHLIAYNASFDRRFLLQSFQQLCQPMPAQWSFHCAYKAFLHEQKLAPAHQRLLGKRKLELVAHYYRVQEAGAVHRAEVDSLLAKRVWEEAIRRLLLTRPAESENRAIERVSAYLKLFQLT